MKRTVLLTILISALFSCNKLKDNPDFYGEWGTSVELEEGHVMLISNDNTGHPYESPCHGTGTLNVKLKGDELLFKKNGSTRSEYVVTTFPVLANQMILFDANTGCVPVTVVTDTIFPGEMYMILDETIYLKKRN